MSKKVLDACCGGRHFWFDKQYDGAVYIDERIAHKGHISRRPNHEVKPNILMDFMSMGFADKTFNLVVFDPPHLHTSFTSNLGKTYGILDPAKWRMDLSMAFDECWRVLADNGTLIFKWSESEINLNDVLNCFSEEPLFGTRYGKTIWCTFFKNGKSDYE